MALIFSIYQKIKLKCNGWVVWFDSSCLLRKELQPSMALTMEPSSNYAYLVLKKLLEDSDRPILVSENWVLSMLVR